MLRDNPVRVRIVISRAPRFDWATHPNLDPANPDDQLVAEAISFGDGAEVFSHDTGPRIRARIAKIQAHEPPAKWLLPVEQTDDQRKIAKLERDLEEAHSRTPKIAAGFNQIDEASSEIRVICPALQPLDPQVTRYLAVEYLASHPRASFALASNEMRRQWEVVSESDAQRYRADYSSFEIKVRDYFAKLHERVRRVGRAAAIDYFVRNHSGVTAEGLRIEFDLEGAGWLLADREDASSLIGSFEMPEPPKKPPSALDSLQSSSLYFPLPPPQPPDPVAFYWFDCPGLGAKHAARQCQDFRATREFDGRVFVLPCDDLPVDLAVHLHVSATNLPRPVDVSAKLTFVEQAVEWSDTIVQAILPDHIRERL